MAPTAGVPQLDERLCLARYTASRAITAHAIGLPGAEQDALATELRTHRLDAVDEPGNVLRSGARRAGP
ncbi:MAG: hypothetical protein JWO90_505 [Solirubrobacterales bacterium]|nr:hypothetical protein [Solirubrobacterales bacterium]